MKKATIALLFIFLLVAGMVSVANADDERLNLLIITVDDMSCDSIGAFGCKLPETTPNIDSLATQGLRFEHAHVQVGNCYPSRNVMFSGLYPHNNHVEGFYQVKDPDYPVMVDFMKGAGYYTGIRGKVTHSTPYHPYAWDCDLTIGPDGKPRHTKNIASYRESTEQGIREAAEAGKPFCLLINISDPHKPFYAENQRTGETIPDPNVPSRVFTPDEVPVPGFLPNDPVVRKELSHYYSSVRRADDCAGEVLAVLDEAGLADTTVVMFLSDHGMPLPFAKTQLYHHSSRTPWIVRWPGVTKPGTVDQQHMISAVDMLPTLLDIVGIKYQLDQFDGRTFIPLLKGETQEGRDMIFKEYNENAGGNRNPMRAVQTRDCLYLYNPWSNGERVMKTATTGTSTYRQMKVLAESDPDVAARLDLFNHRVPQEFFYVSRDPDALNNLVDHPEYQQEVEHLRKAMRDWMEKTGDPLLEVFEHRDDPTVSEAYMQRVQAEADARRAKNRQTKSPGANAASRQNPKQRTDLFKLALPKSAEPGGELVVTLRCTIPEDLGTQLAHVTLKPGPGENDASDRIERKVIEVSGSGDVKVTFVVPASLAGKSVQVATFIGPEYGKHFQHVVSKPITVGIVPSRSEIIH